MAVLGARCVGGRIGEMGTGVGVGAAWMASAMPVDCRLVTVELDPLRVAAARRAPFDLLFVDGGPSDRVVELLRIGGRLVFDDVTPVEALPADSPYRMSDPKREFFFTNSRLVATEVVLPDLRNSLLVGTRVR